MKTLCTLVGMFLVSSVAQAEWLCTETSSIKIGNTITACGVGKSQSEDEARNLAREAAVNEFNQICKISADCNPYDYNVVPKRTDCQVNEYSEQFICYRAIDFEITEHLKKDASINQDDLQKNLEQTRKQIDQLQSKIYEARMYQQAQREVEIKQRQLQALEARETKLEGISQEDQTSPSSYNFYTDKETSGLKFGVSYWDAKLTSSSEVDLALSIAYEQKVTSWLGLQLEFSHGGDMGAQNQDHSTGPANTTQIFDGGMTFNTLAASGIVHTGVMNTYVKGEVGVVQATRTIQNVTYSPIGTGAAQNSNVSISKSLEGVSLGYDSRDNTKGWGTYIEVGARSAGSNVGLTSSVGISYNF